MSSKPLNSDDGIDICIESPEGEYLGKIEELVLDKVKGSIIYLVLSFEGIVGVSNKLFAMPWEAFSYNPQRSRFSIAMDKEKLQNSPGFEKDDRPDMTSAEWIETIRNYYSYSNS